MKTEHLVSTMQARLAWVLVKSDKTSSAIILGVSLKTPFSEVIAVGPLVKEDIVKVGDRVIYREGMSVNTKENQFTQEDYFFVHVNNILGVLDMAAAQALADGRVSNKPALNGPAGPAPSASNEFPDTNGKLATSGPEAQFLEATP